MAPRSVLGIVLAGAIGLGPPGCKRGQLPQPPTGRHQHGLERITIVDYPPPPARIEHVSPRRHRKDGCVWLDGSWAWNGRRWTWNDGSWVKPIAGCYYAAGELFWEPSPSGDELYYRNPAWYPEPPPQAPLEGCGTPRRCE